MLEACYRFIWEKIGGRPWTYILRDTWHRLEGLWILGLIACGAVCGRQLGLKQTLIGLAVFTVGYIFGHLFWGTRYVPGQRAPEKEEKENKDEKPDGYTVSRAAKSHRHPLCRGGGEE